MSCGNTQKGLTKAVKCVIGYIMQQIDYSDLINLTKASYFLDVSYMTIHRWVKIGKLPIVRIGNAPYISLGVLVKIKAERDVNGQTPKTNS